MIIKTKAFQESCKKILDAVGNTAAVANETLELEAHGQILYLNVTNKEYYVTVKMPLDTDAEIHAVVNAHLFLNLINKTTTNTIEITTTATVLMVKANGSYKIPMIFERDKLVDMPKIIIDNITNNFVIKNSILQSILRYNSKEMIKSGGGSTETRRLFYIDEKGAITYSNSACVNTFNLDQKVVLTLTEKIVKLFKLFKSEVVNFTMGFDALANGTVIAKVCFNDDQVTLTSILPADEELIKKFPVSGVRKWAENDYDFTITIDRLALVDAINRLALFSKTEDGDSYTYLYFEDGGVTVFDINKENHERVAYVNTCEGLLGGYYEALFTTNDLKLTLETLEGQYIVMSFGNKQVIVIQRNDITNIIPECKISKL